MYKKISPRLITTTIIGFILFLIPLFYQILWMYISGLYNTQAERVANYNTYLPPFLRGYGQATMLFLVFCIISLVLLAISLKIRFTPLRILIIISIVMESLMTLLNLFSLM
jgi:hypothetical protein